MDRKLGGLTRLASIAVLAAVAAGCGGLQSKAAMVNIGDTKRDVIAAMGAPKDTQAMGQQEAWQYCQTGAGFGHHDYRVIWFYQGRVTGFNSYKSTRPGTSCASDLREIRWEDAPDAAIEIRSR